jgi:2-polyprenyl-3-methyl-5-hydroxy-6-metoxy-1,4-benzoquinol methylase
LTRGLVEADGYDVENYRPDTLATITVLAELAAGGDLLEFGAGTGRLLIPLANRCRTVVGVDLSPAMIGRVDATDLPSNAELLVGSMVDWTTDRRFDVVACVFNTLLEIAGQEDQYRALHNAASLVKPGGKLVVENVHPPLRSLAAGSRVIPHEVPGADLCLVTQTLDWKTQRIDQRMLLVTDGRAVTRRLSLRAIFPAEQDAVLFGSGLRLRSRHSDWRGSPWRSDPKDAETANVVSVYERLPDSHDG